MRDSSFCGNQGPVKGGYWRPSSCPRTRTSPPLTEIPGQYAGTCSLQRQAECRTRLGWNQAAPHPQLQALANPRPMLNRCSEIFVESIGSIDNVGQSVGERPVKQLFVNHLFRKMKILVTHTDKGNPESFAPAERIRSAM